MELALRPPALAPLEIALFHDGGNAWLLRPPAIDGLSPGTDRFWHGTLGIGIGLNSPVGPVRLDVGLRIDAIGGHQPWLPPGQFHLTVGAR